jgi:16S rRNA (guanine527-N7)-methyltransferase
MPLKVVDVGSGAGVPGIPLKILNPHWRLALVESIGKKCAFLQDTLASLGLADVRVLQGRTEEFGRSPEWRDQADLCLARAVAPLATLIELCAPFVRPGGSLIFPKSGNVDAEIKASLAAQTTLNARHLRTLSIPESIGVGNCKLVLEFRKSGRTPPGYPRRVGLAKSRPIRA